MWGGREASENAGSMGACLGSQSLYKLFKHLPRYGATCHSSHRALGREAGCACVREWGILIRVV